MKCLPLLLFAVAIAIAEITELKNQTKGTEQDLEVEESQLAKLTKHDCGYCQGIWSSCKSRKLHSNKCMKRVVKCLKKLTNSAKCYKPQRPTKPGGTTVKSSFRLTHIEYNDTLGNPNSPEFVALKKEVEDSVMPALLKKLGKKLLEFKVTGFEKGSVIVHSETTTTYQNPSVALSSVSDTFMNSGIEGLDVSSIKVEEDHSLILSKRETEDSQMLMLRDLDFRLMTQEKIFDQKLSNMTTILESRFNAMISNITSRIVEEKINLMKLDINWKLITLTETLNMQCKWHCPETKGTCKEGICHCKKGFEGSDCSQYKCNDKSDDCDKIMSGMVSVCFENEVIRENCKWSCGFCGEKCSDRSSSCAGIISEWACNDDIVIMDNCRESCGFCDDKPGFGFGPDEVGSGSGPE